jgi:hypothetical protein
MKHVKLFEQFINENELYEKKYSDQERKELEQKGMAMPGGRFPVKDATDLKNAIWLLPKAKGNVEDVIAYLAKRLKELGATNYENMFNKTLHTMGIDKDISNYSVAESVVNEGVKTKIKFYFSSPQGTMHRFPKALAAAKVILKECSGSTVKVISQDNKNYSAILEADLKDPEAFIDWIGETTNDLMDDPDMDVSDFLGKRVELDGRKDLWVLYEYEFELA